MMIVRHQRFKKNFKVRIARQPKLDRLFESRLKLFLLDRSRPLLKDHKLVGTKKGYRAFSLGGDIRVVYRIEGQTMLLYDIGSHNQVY